MPLRFVSVKDEICGKESHFRNSMRLFQFDDCTRKIIHGLEELEIPTICRIVVCGDLLVLLCLYHVIYQPVPLTNF